jgi:sulfonate transport system substrate-binding protein
MSWLSRPPRLKGPRGGARAVALLSLVAVGAAACGSSSSTKAASSDSATSTPANVISTAVPAGTVLRVAQQFDADLLPIQLSGATLPSTLKIDWSNFTGGPQVVQALEAGAIDVGTLGDVPLAYTEVANKGVVAIVATQTAGRTSGIVTAPGSNITSIAQLKGKKLAFTQATAPQGFMLHALQNAGLSKADVDLINIASQSQVSAALESHSVDAAATAGQLIYQYQAKNPDTKVLAWSQAPVNTSGYGYWVTTQSALANPAKAAAIAAFIRAEIAGQKWVNANPTIWIQKYYVGVEKLSTTLGTQLNNATGVTTFPPINSAVISAQQTVIDLLSTNGFIPTGLQASKQLDSRFNSVIAAASAGT